MKNLLYISPRDMRKNRADPVHIMSSCYEFQKNGFNVSLITPRVFRKENVKTRSEIWQLYNLEKAFRIVELPTILFDKMPSLITRFQKFVWFFLYFLYLIVFKKLKKGSIIYSKCFISIVPVILLKRIGLIRNKIYFETPVYIKNKKSHKFVAKFVDGIIVFNEYVKNNYIKNYMVQEKKIFKTNFGSQFREYSEFIKNDDSDCEITLGFQNTEKIVLYSGKIAPKMREIEYILESARILSKITFVFVGMKDEFRDFFKSLIKKKNLNNVIFFGFQPLKRFYSFIKCADILVSYYDSYDKLSYYQRSPAKSTIYVSTGKPVIFADLPSLREKFSEDIVFYVPPDNPKLLSEKIEYIFNNPIIVEEKVRKCLKFAKLNTKSKSYKSISNFISR